MIRRVLRQIGRFLLSPAWGGAARWGNYPRARLSILSVLTFVLVIVAFVVGLALEKMGHSRLANAAGWVAFGLVVTALVSGDLDERRDRRLGLSPRRWRWRLSGRARRCN